MGRGWGGGVKIIMLSLYLFCYCCCFKFRSGVWEGGGGGGSCVLHVTVTQQHCPINVITHVCLFKKKGGGVDSYQTSCTYITGVPLTELSTVVVFHLGLEIQNILRENLFLRNGLLEC